MAPLDLGTGKVVQIRALHSAVLVLGFAKLLFHRCTSILGEIGQVLCIWKFRFAVELQSIVTIDHDKGS